MKTKRMISTVFASLLIMVLCFTAKNLSAQTKNDSEKMEDGCMMKDGKMMHHKDGKMMPMNKDMTMKNGTKCMTNGECITKDGKKTMLKEGECIDMNGKMGMCNHKMKQEKSAAYTCSMHPEVKSDKPGKCPKCKMDLIEKK